MPAFQTFKGRSEDAEAPFLSTDFWTKDKRLVGIVDRVFKIDGRDNYAVKLAKPIELHGETVDVVFVGESAGLRMAMQAARLRELRVEDRVNLLCTGETASKEAGKSPRKNFEIEVQRPKVQGEPPYEPY